MKKKKNLTPEEEKQLKLNSLKKHYDAANEQLGLEGHDVIDQVHMLIDAANELQSEICSMSDDIKINDLAKVQELTPIDKKTYLDFVNICSLKNNDKLQEKAIGKFEEDFAHRLFITNLRHTFLESYMNGDELKITDEENEEYKPFTDYESDEFLKIMEDSAKKREYLNLVLWKQYKSIAKAAEYITDLELNYKDFKNLSDWQYYKDGGYPSPTSPSKIWAIFNKWAYAYRLLSKYDYKKTINDHEYEFGINCTLGTTHEVEHPWQVEKEKEID